MAAYLGYNAAEEVFPLHIWARRAVQLRPPGSLHISPKQIGTIHGHEAYWGICRVLQGLDRPTG